ncbi:MAG: hypothetical protein WAL56_09115 [Candidatus Sulfotelmatobacter sp.]
MILCSFSHDPGSGLAGVLAPSAILLASFAYVWHGIKFRFDLAYAVRAFALTDFLIQSVCYLLCREALPRLSESPVNVVFKPWHELSFPQARSEY